MFAVDTNVLIYAADRDSPCHTACARHLDGWRRQSTPWYLTWNVFYEFLRVTTHPKVFRTPWTTAQAWRFIEAVMAAPTLTLLLPSERHAQVLGELLAELPQVRGNVLHDAHTAALLREHGISRIWTRDADFHRFPFLTVIDPVAA